MDQRRSRPVAKPAIAMANTTATTPTQTPVLKIPAMAEQPVSRLAAATGPIADFALGFRFMDAFQGTARANS
jgi:hypothetical protein